MKKYPYENISLIDIPGERWKPIRDYGLEGLYEVSDFGRIKSLGRKRLSKHGTVTKTPPKIRKLHLGIVTNKTVNAPLYTLLITLFKDGVRYNISVGRLVYSNFIESIELSDKKIFISYRDGDGRNLHFSNLIKSDSSTLSQNSAKSGRKPSPLCKPVNQFTPEGNLVDSFPSIARAAQQTGINASSIDAVTNGKGRLYKGFAWQPGEKGTAFDDTLFKKPDNDGINKSLALRLGLKKADLKLTSLPAFLDLSLKDREGEEWRPIPGYESRYHISSHGRVKSLQRVSKNRQQKWVFEAIKCLYTVQKDNTTDSGTLKVMLAGPKGKKGICVGRMVYHVFVQQFDLSRRDLRVYCKDGNTLNLHSSNLILRAALWSINKK